MREIGPELPTTYRQEIVSPLFQLIQAGESCAVAGVSSMGKSRLLQFILRPDVHQTYLKERAASTLIVWADCNRMADISEWGLYELILTALAEASSRHANIKAIRDDLHLLRKESILEGNALLARRYVESATRMICQERNLQVCLLLDEFDESYRSLPGQALANLRALRDANKYCLSYILFMRDHPINLRSPDEGEGVEGFYELVSHTVMGLKPFTWEDSQQIIQQLVMRRGHELGELPDGYAQKIYSLSGGHPGLMVALIGALVKSQPDEELWAEWAKQQPTVQEACRKIWGGLRPEERRTLTQLAQGIPSSFRERQSLELKGLLQTDETGRFRFFTPVFRHYISTLAPVAEGPLWVDAQAGSVWVDGKSSPQLTSKEFELVTFLYDRRNEICSSEDIISHLYPGHTSYNVSENTIAALIGRVRKKIEPNAKHPRYLLNVKGRGYKLVEKPGQ